MSAYVSEVNDEDFESEVLKSSQPVLVEFWAEWCPPCKMLAPTVESLAEKYQDKLKVVKLNVDQGVDSSSRYGIKAIPTLILFPATARRPNASLASPRTRKTSSRKCLINAYQKTVMSQRERCRSSSKRG